MIDDSRVKYFLSSDRHDGSREAKMQSAASTIARKFMEQVSYAISNGPRHTKSFMRVEWYTTKRFAMFSAVLM